MSWHSTTGGAGDTSSMMAEVDRLSIVSWTRKDEIYLFLVRKAHASEVKPGHNRGFTCYNTINSQHVNVCPRQNTKLLLQNSRFPVDILHDDTVIHAPILIFLAGYNTKVQKKIQNRCNIQRHQHIIKIGNFFDYLHWAWTYFSGQLPSPFVVTLLPQSENLQHRFVRL